MFHLDHYAISISNAEKSINFYKKLQFDIIKDWQSEEGALRIIHMIKDGFILELFCYADGDEIPAFTHTLDSDLKVRGAKHLGLWVDDLDEAAEYLVNVGVLKEKPSISSGRLGRPYFFIKDPDGIFVEIISKRQTTANELSQ